MRRISSCDPSGRTPSCTAISSGSRFRAANPIFHRVEPLPAPFGDRVRRHFETRRQVVPEAGVFGGQYDDDFRSGKRRGEVVDRARQYGYAPQQHELLGTRPSHAASAARPLR